MYLILATTDFTIVVRMLSRDKRKILSALHKNLLMGLTEPELKALCDLSSARVRQILRELVAAGLVEKRSYPDGSVDYDIENKGIDALARLTPKFRTKRTSR